MDDTVPEKVTDNEDSSLRVEDLADLVNIAESLDKGYLDKLGNSVVDKYRIDERSREDWLRMYEEAMKIANQVFEPKNDPWPNASNVKFPLITIGAMQFHARAYPALLPSKGIVQTGTIGIDADGSKYLLAKLVGAHMNYQFEHEMDSWEEDMDKLLATLPITGCEFKKTYFDPIKGINCSEYVRAADLVVDFYAKSIEEAYCKTHIIHMSSNDVVELQRAGIFSPVVLGTPAPRKDKVTSVMEAASRISAPSLTVDAPYKILEWHGYMDLDDDGYQEPYIVTVEEESRKVLRINARYYKDSVTRNSNDEVVRIKPIEYFTKYDFVPNPTGGIYGIGFGILLGPINHAVNTMINQLVDSGTLSNLQSGYISRNLRIKNGRSMFKPGEWKEVNAGGMDIRQGLFPLPVREPSMVLFQLLQLLIGAGERLTSTTDMMVGENPGQNQKATTTMAVIDQGMKVFTAIYKRIRRAMSKEFDKVFDLNYYYLNEDKTRILFDGNAKMTRDMYNRDTMIVYPSADPNISSQIERMQRAQLLMSWLPLGGFNDYEIKRRALDAMGEDDPDALLLDPAQNPPPPDPKLVKVQQDAIDQDFRRKLDTMEFITTAQQRNKELDIKATEAETKRLQAMLDGFAKGADIQHKARALIQKELSDRRKVSAQRAKSSN